MITETSTVNEPSVIAAQQIMPVAIIGFGWMGRVHSAAYRRLPEHFPDLGVSPRLLVAADVSEDRRAHAERVGFERTTDDWRAVVVEARDVNAAPVMQAIAQLRKELHRRCEGRFHILRQDGFIRMMAEASGAAKE